jgi:hypothetical protein
MAKIKGRRLIWEPSSSSSVVSYKLYWAEQGEVNYDSPCAMVGNVSEVMLPEQVPSFPVVRGPIELGITAVNEVGNESDMVVIAAPFQFSVPDAPTSPRLEALKEYHVCQGANPESEERKPGNEVTGSDLGDDSDEVRG